MTTNKEKKWDDFTDDVEDTFRVNKDNKVNKDEPNGKNKVANNSKDTKSAETSTIQRQSFSTDPRPDGGNKVVSEDSSDRIQNEEESFSRIVGKYSVCGVCQGAFSGGSATVTESKEKFEGTALYSAVHPECKDGPQVIYVFKREQEKDKPALVESKRIIEIPARNIDSVKEEERKKRKEDRE